VKQSEHRPRQAKAAPKAREPSDEKNLSAEQPSAQKNPRIPQANGDAGRAQRAAAASAQGPRSTDRIDSAKAARVGNKPKARKAFGFGPEHRLHKPHDFRRIQREGTRIAAGPLVIYGLQSSKPSRHRSDSEPGQTATPRLGMTVSRRIGNAAVRNRLKRRIRECFRTKLKLILEGGMDIVVIARDGAAAKMRFAAMRDALVRATIALGDRAK
jgi:ribonuclease P protein component